MLMEKLNLKPAASFCPKEILFSNIGCQALVSHASRQKHNKAVNDNLT